jgi:DNA-binding NarL/FixJ family response regulator
MQNNSTLVYLADDHTLVAQGLANLLNNIGYGNVKIFANGKDLYKACLSQKPDLVFLDVHMNEWDGITTLTELRANNFTMPIIIISMLAEKRVIEKAIEYGANAYLHKSSDEHEIAKAIKIITAGDKYISDHVLVTGKDKVLIDVLDKFELTEPISDREREVLQLYCDGLETQQIADKLFISPRTVETHKKNLMQKFQVGSLSKMIALTFKYNIIK